MKMQGEYMKKAIRVLHVLHGMDCGGAENMIMNLYRNIDREKVQFDFLVHTNKKCFFDDEIKSLGGNIYVVPYFNGINVIKYKKSIYNFFSQHRGEFVAVHGHVGSCAHIYLKLAKDAGIYTIAHSHSTKPTAITLKNILYRWFTFKVRRIADYFFGCSRASGCYRFGEKIVSGSNFSVLNNAIEVDKYTFDTTIRENVRKEYQLNDRLVIGNVGRFCIAKNHQYLLDIFNLIAQKLPDARLLLVGDGALRKEIENKADALGIRDKIIMTGVCSNVNELLQAMDCFVFPSLYEGLPVTVIEAQAAGLQCFISENITNEVCISGNVEQIPINVSPQVWADTVIGYFDSKMSRNDVSSEIANAGYDIKTTAAWLTKFYMNI